ncbi:biotin/lipoyl-binding protein [Neglectibacter caecimuris]|uniref:biotin/lipoyl-binding protein n=1 Tax=Neglectibacter caecimuris TaxID=3093658 RepID=UPI002AC8DE33|nr:biotin/lipoyl-binding protein [Neglectibacter sp. M00184]
MAAKKRKKVDKRLIAVSISTVVIALLIIGLWLFLQYRNDSKFVEVIPVSQVADSYWGDQSSSSGQIISDYIQELYPASDKIISEIFVQEGQEVHIGDPLLQYDKTQLELDVELKEVAVKQADLNVTNAQKQLKKLQNTKPSSTPRPTTRPSSRPTTRPSAKPSSSPTPTPVPPADVTLYSQLDLNSVPYEGSGTSEDPYIFLCTKDCVMTPEFLRWLLGDPGIQPEPSSTPDGDLDGDGDTGETDPPEDGEEPTPAPTQKPSSQLVSPFAAVFEVRDGNSNYGQLISAFKLDGTQLSANFQLANTIPGYNTIDSIGTIFGATPKPNADNYNDMGYTSAELSQLITEKKQEIQNLQHVKKQAQLDLKRANLQLKNSTVLSTVDGVVRSLLDLETATAEGKPFLVVSGDSTYYVSGALSENVLGIVQVGDQVTVMDYMTGNSYAAEIVSIADYPLEADSGLYYYGSGNPNSSTYEFTAVLEQGDGLINGQNVDITLNIQEESSADALYIQNAYIREDAAGSYVMKAGIDNRLLKQYVQTGRSLYGYALEIKSGLTIDDYIAFPYGPDVEEGVKVRLQGSEDGPITDGASSIPSLDMGDTPDTAIPVGGELSSAPSPEDGEDVSNASSYEPDSDEFPVDDAYPIPESEEGVE